MAADKKKDDHLYFPLSQLSAEESIFRDADKGVFSRKYKPILTPILGKQLAVNTYYANELIAAANTRITLDLLKIFDELKINFKVNRRDVTAEERDSALDAAMAQLIKSKKEFLDRITPEEIPVIQDNVKTFLDQTLASPNIKAFETHFETVAGFLKFANSAISTDSKYIGTAAALERVINTEKRLFKLGGGQTGETIEHVIKTCWFSLIMAEALDDFDEADCEKLSIICMGHDGGKALLPEQVLYKKGRLTQVENDIMKSHVLLSYILSSGNQANPGLESFAMALHHLKENPDLPQSYGIGPKGHTSFYQYLTPDAQVLLNQTFHETKKYYRVICIADTFEAISAERVYKRASSIGKSLDIMLKDNRDADFFYQPYLDVFIQTLLRKFVPRNLNFKITNQILDAFYGDKKLTAAQRTFYKTHYRGVVTNACTKLSQDLDCVIYTHQDKTVVERLSVPPKFFLDQIYIK